MRRSGPALIWLALAVSGCSAPSPAATDSTVTTTASSSSSAAPTRMPTTTRPPTPSGSPDVASWAGPVRPLSTTDAALAPDATGEGFGPAPDAADAARDYVDIQHVAADSRSQPHWRIGLGGAPPPDSADLVVSYGLAFETTGDGAPDYVVGLSNDATSSGELRIWVTDLATGVTEEQDGPPYGFPIEFVTPSEAAPGQDGPPTMTFTFLGGSRPSGITLATPFYAWASVEEDGEVVAWDYAPDEGWIGAPAEAAATPEVAAVPPRVVSPLAPAGMPECQAAEFDFVGEGTLRELGLDTATPVTPPDIERVGKIWVTRDLMPHDFGPPGGAVEMTRMLCFEFPDGTGGSGWPVDPTWQPPTGPAIVSDDADTSGPPPTLLAVALVALLALVVSAFAFRRRR